MKIIDNMKDKLYQYTGGGYDGCIWEWNFCYIDNKGKWHDIYSSGCDGIKKEEDFNIDKIEYTYDLTQEGINEFAKESNAQQVFNVLKFLNKKGYDFQLKCSKCEQLCDLREMDLINWHGCGGIASTADNYICNDCFNIGSCGYCGEYFGEDFKRYGDNDYCYDCAISTIENWLNQIKDSLVRNKLEFGNLEQIELLQKIDKLNEQLLEIKREGQL